MSDSLWPHGLYSAWNSPGQNTGVGSLSLLQGIFPTQGLNPGLPHCRQILYQLSHQGSPRILEWVAYPFSRGSSWPRNRTGVSCIAGRFFTSWAMREVNNYTTDVLPQKWKLWTWHEVPQIRVMGGGAPRGTSPFHHEGCINLLDTHRHIYIKSKLLGPPFIMGCNLSGFSVHGILQAKILEWVTISFSFSSLVRTGKSAH